ncbi:hypothetical protein Mapa_013336 [Marchantia paleacea]|nr:hypothetical protein Mapa_013336 [Marchantia paleacea]
MELSFGNGNINLPFNGKFDERVLFISPYALRILLSTYIAAHLEPQLFQLWTIQAKPQKNSICSAWKR